MTVRKICAHPMEPLPVRRKSQTSTECTGYSTDSGDIRGRQSSSNEAPQTFSWLIVQRLQHRPQLISSHRDRQIFMHQKPVRAALFPDAGVAQLRLYHFVIFGFLVEL